MIEICFPSNENNIILINFKGFPLIFSIENIVNDTENYKYYET